MSFSDSSNAQFSIVKETTWGEIPTTPAWQRCRLTGEGLAPNFETTTSNEINPLAAITDLIQTGASAGGQFNFELSYGTSFDILFESTLRASFDAFGVCTRGTDDIPFSLEKIIFNDSDDFFFRYSGCKISSLAMNLSDTDNAPINGTIDVLGKIEEDSDDAVAGATYTAANTNPVMSMPELRHLTITGVTGDYCATDLSFTVADDLRAQNGRCTDTTTYPDYTNKGIGYGTKNITGNLSIYFTDRTMYTAFKNGKILSLSFILTDGTRGYKVTFPAIKYAEGSVPAADNGSDVIQPFTWQGLYDATEGTDMKIEKIPSLTSGAAVKLTEVTIAPSPDFRGSYYKDGTQNDGKDVYASVDGTNAIWWSTADLAWTVTAYGDIGSFPTNGWENTNAADPTGTWAILGSATGSLQGAAYDPTA